MHARTHHVVQVNEGVVDGNDLDVTVLNSISEDNSSNSAKSATRRLSLPVMSLKT